MFKERIEYDNLKMLEEATRKRNLCYDKNKSKRESVPNWGTKIQDNFDPRRKNNKFHKNTGNIYKRYQSSNHKNFKPQNPAAKEREHPTTFNKNTTQRENLKCWECGEPHYFKYCPIRKKIFNVDSIQEAIVVRDMVRSMPRMSVALENR